MDKPLHHIDHMMWDINDPTSLNTIAGMMTFKGKIDKNILCRILEERLLRYDRFKEKVVDAGGQPAWRPDEDFDIHCHLHHTALPEPGDYATLQAEISHLMSIPFDYSKPLWKVNLIDNYKGGSVIVYRLHHALADGIALIKVVFSLTGESREASLGVLNRAEEDTAAPVEQKDLSEKVKDFLHFGESMYNEAQALLKDPETLKHNLKDTWDSTVELGKLLFGKGVEGSVAMYKGDMSVRKKPAWTDQPIDLDTIKKIGKAHDATINDILLALMTGAIRFHMLINHQKPEDVLRVVIPVNIRKPHEPIKVENKIGFISLELPVHLKEAKDRIAYIREKTQLLKKSFEPIVLYSLLHVLADMLPKNIERKFTELMGTKVGAVVTNVPGPRQAIYLAGVELEDIMFWVPQTSTLGMGVSLLSYNNKAYLGVVTDPNIVSDPDNIIKGFYLEFEDLAEQVLSKVTT